MNNSASFRLCDSIKRVVMLLRRTGGIMLETAGDVSAAAAAFAGLVLVFFGASVASFDAFDETQRDAVRWTYRRRAWPALVSLVAALVSCALSLSAKMWRSEALAIWGLVFLAIVGIGILVSAVLAVLEIG